MKTLIITCLLTSSVMAQTWRNIGELSDKQVVALTLWGEARGEGQKGIIAVASVIHNRDNLRGDLRGVCLKPYQFSVWNNKQSIKIPNDKVFNYCLALADQMVNKKFKPTHNYRFYYNPSLCSPRWARNVRNSTTIGNHRFVSL